MPRPEFHIQVFLAGREGVQEEYIGGKREAIRRCKRLVGQGSFGSAGAVYVVEQQGAQDGYENGTVKRTLIFQCHKAMTKQKREYVKIDEL